MEFSQRQSWMKNMHFTFYGNFDFMFSIFLLFSLRFIRLQPFKQFKAVKFVRQWIQQWKAVDSTEFRCVDCRRQYTTAPYSWRACFSFLAVFLFAYANVGFTKWFTTLKQHKMDRKSERRSEEECVRATSVDECWTLTRCERGRYLFVVKCNHCATIATNTFSSRFHRKSLRGHIFNDKRNMPFEFWVIWIYGRIRFFSFLFVSISLCMGRWRQKNRKIQSVRSLAKTCKSRLCSYDRLRQATRQEKMEKFVFNFNRSIYFRPTNEALASSLLS